MGLSIAKLLDMFAGKEERKLTMLGLDAAGKTTILYNLKLGETVASIPTVGFNCERIEYKGVEFVSWDVGGQDKIRRLWKHYLEGTDGLMFVVDSSDAERVDESRAELEKLLADDALRDAKLLIYANKQDLPHALSPSELADRLGLHDLRGRDWYIQATTATRGDGLYEGLDWLVTTLKKTPKRTAPATAF